MYFAKRLPNNNASFESEVKKEIPYRETTPTSLFGTVFFVILREKKVGKMNLFEITLDQHMDMIEYAGNTLDKHDLIDSSAPSLVEVCIY